MRLCVCLCVSTKLCDKDVGLHRQPFEPSNKMKSVQSSEMTEVGGGKVLARFESCYAFAAIVFAGC